MNLFKRITASKTHMLLSIILSTTLVFALLVSAKVIAQQAQKDELNAAMVKLEESFDRVLVDPTTKPNTLLFQLAGGQSSDRVVQLSHPVIKNLEAEILNFKIKIESASDERSKTNDTRMISFLEIVNRYFILEQRLYLNYVRNAHLISGQEFHYQSHHYDYLNLKLNATIGLLLYFDEQLKVRRNLWHTQERIELGMTPIDKEKLELAALQSVKDSSHYAKLIQLVTLKERLINQWAMGRMSSGASFVPPKSCGSNLLSFQERHYFENLQKEDQFQAFSDLSIAHLTPVIAGHLLFQKQDLVLLFKGYFNTWPSFQINRDFADESTAAIQAQAEKNFNEQVPAQTIQKLEEQLKKDSKILFIHSNYISDAWDNKSIGDRSARILFDYETSFLVDALVLAAQGQQIDEVIKDPMAARQKAKEWVQKYGDLNFKNWKNEVSNKIASKLSEVTLSQEIIALKEKRFEDKFSEIKSSITQSRVAKTVSEAAGRVYKIKRDELKSQGKVVWGEKDFETQTVSAGAYLNLRLKLWTPEQLSNFFFKKLQKLSEQENMYLVEHNIKIEEVAQEMLKNTRLLEGVKKIFSDLNEQYYQTLEQKQLSPLSVQPFNTPLYDVLLPSLKKSYLEFARSLKVLPVSEMKKSEQDMLIKNLIGLHAAPAPQLGVDIKKLRQKPQNVKQYAPLVIELKNAKDGTKQPDIFVPVDPETIPTIPRTHEQDLRTFRLYLEALAILNVSELVTGVHTPVSAKHIVQQKNIPERVHSPLELESVLQEQFKESDISLQIARSLYDQQLMAEVIIEEAKAQHPLLALQPDNSDSESPSVLDYVFDGYMPDIKHGSMQPVSVSESISSIFKAGDARDKTMIKKSLKMVYQNARPLLLEACEAKPFEKDNEDFRNLFSSAHLYRRLIAKVDSKKYEKLDAELQYQTRTTVKKVLDVVDPIVGLLAFAFLLLILLPMPGWAAGAMALMNGMSFRAGMLGVRSLFGLSEGYTAILSSMGSAGWVIGKAGTLSMALSQWLFVGQLALQSYVACIELPGQIKDEMQVKDSRATLVGSTSVEPQDLLAIHAQIYSEAMSIAINGAMQTLFLPMTIRMHRNAFGITGAKAYSRLSGGQVPEGEALTFSQSAKSFWKYNRVMTLPESAKVADIQKLMVPKMAEVFDSPDVIELTLGARINELAVKIREQVKMGDGILKSVHQEPKLSMKDLYAIASPKGVLKQTARDQNFLDEIALGTEEMGPHGPEVKFKSDYSKDVTVFDGVKKQARNPSDYKLLDEWVEGTVNESARIHYAAAKLLLIERTELRLLHWRLKYMLSDPKVGDLTVAEIKNQMVTSYFSSFNATEWKQWRGLSDWVLKGISKNQLGRFENWNQLKDFKRTLRSFDFLTQEAQMIELRNPDPPVEPPPSE